MSNVIHKKIVNALKQNNLCITEAMLVPRETKIISEWSHACRRNDRFFLGDYGNRAFNLTMFILNGPSTLIFARNLVTALNGY